MRFAPLAMLPVLVFVAGCQTLTPVQIAAICEAIVIITPEDKQRYAALCPILAPIAADVLDKE